MKLPCELVQDLLPLYHDEACSPTSAAMVAEHLQDCDPCRKMLEDMDTALDVPAEGIEAASGLKAIKKIWKKKLVRAFLVGAAAILLLLGARELLVWWKPISVPPEEIHFFHRYYTEDGSLAYGYGFPYDFVDIHEYTTVDGVHYIWHTRSLIASSSTPRGPSQGSTLNLESPFLADDTMEPVLLQAIYFGKPGDDDCILLWERGMELPGPEAAPHYEPVTVKRKEGTDGRGEIVMPVYPTIDITE